MQELVARLQAVGLVTVDADPHDRRATVVRLAPVAHHLGRDAGFVAAQIERILAERIGADGLEALRRALAADWGSPPTPVELGIVTSSDGRAER
jgi:DNA-binding MarR family transcriptional regulator